ncbi:MAG: hypothetical protein JO356_01740 [Acidobacteria bacterium]|nr:hypothetical protein [Acidobacteriota bacterium]
MDQEDRVKLEAEEYRKNLESLVTARTEQLRQTLSRNTEVVESLKAIQSPDSLEQMRAAVQAAIEKLERPVQAEAPSADRQLKRTGIPAVDKLMSTIDTEEKALARSEALQAAIKNFNAGHPIQAVNAYDLRQCWDAGRRVHAEVGPPTPECAIGLAVYAAHGFEAASCPPEQLTAITWRCQLLSSFVDRGVLRDYIRGEELDERAFCAAATMPCDKEDFAQAMIPSMVKLFPPEELAKFLEEMKAHAYDIDKPPVDQKFLDWLCNNC